jgi:hypothetical protein
MTMRRGVIGYDDDGNEIVAIYWAQVDPWTRYLRPWDLGPEATEDDVVAYRHLVWLLGDSKLAWNGGDWARLLYERGFWRDENGRWWAPGRLLVCKY